MLFKTVVLSRQNRSPLKSVWLDRFWQKKFAKSGPAGSILAAKTGPPLPILVPLVKM